MVYSFKVPILHLMIFISLCLLPACAGNENIETITDQLAELECKAINLRNKRFELASAIRILESDTTPSAIHQLDSLKAIGENTTIESGVLADSIKSHLEYIFKHQLKTQEEKQNFSEMLKAKVVAKKCINPADDLKTSQ